VVVASSRPSEPWTSQTLFEPRLRKTRARGSSQAFAKTPSTWYLTPAGLASGPMRLKMVLVRVLIGPKPHGASTDDASAPP